MSNKIKETEAAEESRTPSFDSFSGIEEAIEKSGFLISNSIKTMDTNLTSLLSSSTIISILQMMLVAVVGALSAYLFNVFHWKVVEKKKKISGATNELRDLINDLEKVSVEYWVRDYNEKDKESISVDEVSIKSKVRLISRYIQIVVSEIKNKKASQEIQKLDDFRSDIFDLVTGDEFESKDRKSSKGKAQKILNKCSDIRATILSLDMCK